MERESVSKPLTIFCLNIQNPSLERAGKQFPWLRKQPADVLVLTECKKSEGCLFLEKCFQAYGYQVVFPKPIGNEYAVLIASRHKLTLSPFSDHVDYLRARVASVKVTLFGSEFEVIGVYVPSRDSYERPGKDFAAKREQKKLFVSGLLNALKSAPTHSYRFFCGDLNVLEPDHIPHYSVFEDWEYEFYLAMEKYQLHDAFRHLHPKVQEYSWVGKSGDGYRYDHCFVSSSLIPLVDECYYLHEPRELKLSDHSALVTIIRLHSMS